MKTLEKKIPNKANKQRKTRERKRKKSNLKFFNAIDGKDS